MEAVLHIEPIVRQTPTPLNVGHSETLFYGERLTPDGENVGDVSSMITLGAPLEGVDYGAHSTSIPLVKTVEYMPDYSRSQGHVYIEKLHYLKDKKHLIPYRAKIHSGANQGLRINHLPSLNFIRQDVTGFNQDVWDPRSEIIGDILLRDDIFRQKHNQPLHDWLLNEFSPSLDHQMYNVLTFDSENINRMIPRYINQVRDTPCDYSQRDLKEIAQIICPTQPNERSIPASFQLPEVQNYHVQNVRHRLVGNTFDFRTPHPIAINQLERIDHNPRNFQNVCNWFDTIPVTDFNVDIVLALNNEIEFYHEHVAVNRFGVFMDSEVGLYTPESIVRDYIDEWFLSKVLQQFIQYHSNLNDDIRHVLDFDRVKIKLMKTMSDEAAVLLYRYNSAPNDPPMCGVYFDIALQSLAPISVMPIRMAN